VPRNQALVGLLAPQIVTIERSPNRHKKREQQERERDTHHRQESAPLIAERILADKRGQGHS
jgi:hypothetical protein